MIVRVLTTILVFVLLVACRTPGQVAYDGPHGKLTVDNPSGANSPGGITIGADGSVTATTSGEHAPASYTEKATVNVLMIIGGAFALLAVGCFVMRAKWPLMPSNAPIGCAIASGACFMMPTIIDRYTKYVLIAAGLWLGWTWLSYRHNKKLKEQDPLE